MSGLQHVPTPDLEQHLRLLRNLIDRGGPVSAHIKEKIQIQRELYRREQIEVRIAKLEAQNKLAASWGAAVGARQEQINGLRRSLPPAMTPVPLRPNPDSTLRFVSSAEMVAVPAPPDRASRLLFALQTLGNEIAGIDFGKTPYEDHDEDLIVDMTLEAVHRLKRERDDTQDWVTDLSTRHQKALSDAEFWKGRHADVVARNAILRQRPDLPVDRLPAHEKLAGLQRLVRSLIDNDPNEPISDAGHTVFDHWRHDAERLLA